MKKPPRIQRSRSDYTDPYKQTQRPGRARPGGERERPVRSSAARPVRSPESRPPRAADSRSLRSADARPARSYEDRPPRSAAPRKPRFDSPRFDTSRSDSPRSASPRAATPRPYAERSYGARPPRSDAPPRGTRFDGPRSNGPRSDGPARAPRPYTPRPERAPGAFAAGAATGRFTVNLDPDVARVFRGDASVNKALRLVLQLMQVTQGPPARPVPAWRERGGDARTDARSDRRTEPRAKFDERKPRAERDATVDVPEVDAVDTNVPRFLDDGDDADQEE